MTSMEETLLLNLKVEIISVNALAFKTVLVYSYQVF